MSNLWIIDTRYRIYTMLKHKLEQKYKDTYKDFNVTNVPYSNDTVNKFPTVCYTELSSNEITHDLEHDRVEAVRISNQIAVYMQKEDETEALAIMGYIVDLMKSKQFTASSIADMDYSSDLVRVVTRFNRKLGRDDII